MNTSRFFVSAATALALVGTAGIASAQSSSNPTTPDSATQGQTPRTNQDSATPTQRNGTNATQRGAANGSTMDSSTGARSGTSADGTNQNLAMSGERPPKAGRN